MIKILKKNSSAFSLVEILIVLVISSSFLVFGVANYRDYSRRQQTVIVKRDLVSDLRQAQKDAISGRKPEGCIGKLVSYNFAFIEGSNSTPQVPDTYTISVTCDNASVLNTTNLKQETIPLPIDVRSLLPTISFKPFTLGTNIAAANTAITITYPGVSGSTQTITIQSTGEIN